MQYHVPQFIEVEDKLVGPLTLKQFIYLTGAGGLCVVFFSYLPFIFAVLLSLPVAGFAGALAFYKINNKPFVDVLESAFHFYTNKRLMLWKAAPPKPAAATPKPAATQEPTPQARTGPRLTRGKLSELAWSLDVQRPKNPQDTPQ